MSSKYYDGTKLLSLTDINGNKPELYIVTTNRTGGKTTYFGRMVVNNWKKGKGLFCLIYRFDYELDNCADKFFKDISDLFFTGDVMTAKKVARGTFVELSINDKVCGYAISLNKADQIKKYSHIFCDVTSMIFDEFQSETNHYCDNEVKKLISIHTSIARGKNKQVRYVPVYMIANPVTILNPYYVELGISNRLSSEVKFLRGDGYVLEQGYVESAAEAQKESGFNRAFSNNSYVAYSSQAVYLNDNTSFIEKPTGHSKYLASLRYNNCDYAVREYTELGIIYCDDKIDSTFKGRISITIDDHDINYVMLKRNDFFISQLRYFFEHGCFRFKNMKCKEAILKMLAY